MPPWPHLAVVTPRQAIERAERQNDRYCPTPALRARSRARPKICQSGPPRHQECAFCRANQNSSIAENRVHRLVPCHSRTHKKRARLRDDIRDCTKMRASYFCILQCEQNLKSIPYEQMMSGQYYDGKHRHNGGKPAEIKRGSKVI